MNTTQAAKWAHASDQIYGKVAAYLPQSLGGKMQRKATMLLCYGAGIKRAAKVSGLSLRRVKVIAKQLPTL